MTRLCKSYDAVKPYQHVHSVSPGPSSDSDPDGRLHHFHMNLSVAKRMCIYVCEEFFFYYLKKITRKASWKGIVF